MLHVLSGMLLPVRNLTTNIRLSKETPNDDMFSQRAVHLIVCLSSAAQYTEIAKTSYRVIYCQIVNEFEFAKD